MASAISAKHFQASFLVIDALPGCGCDIAIELANGQTRAGSHRDNVGPQVGGEDPGSASEAAGGV